MNRKTDRGPFLLAAIVIAICTVHFYGRQVLRLQRDPDTPQERGQRMLKEAQGIAGQFPWRVFERRELGGYGLVSRSFEGGKEVACWAHPYDPIVVRRYKKMEAGSYVLFELDTTTVDPKNAATPFDLLRPRYILDEKPINPYLLRL